MARAIMRIGGITTADVVIDVGGGSGVIAKYFLGHAREVHIVDPSPRMLARCCRHASLHCHAGVAEQLPFADASVDKVVLADAFHHFPDQDAAVGEIQRVLRTGGIAVIAEFDPRTFGGWLIMHMERVLRLGSTFHTPAALAERFARAGFATRLIETKTKDYFLCATKVLA